MMYDACQFTENHIDCRKDHPAHAAWKASQSMSRPPDLTGDLGQPKTKQQMEIVTTLAQQLSTYMKQPVPKKVKGRSSSRECNGAAPMMAMAECAAPPRAMARC